MDNCYLSNTYAVLLPTVGLFSTLFWCELLVQNFEFWLKISVWHATLNSIPQMFFEDTNLIHIICKIIGSTSHAQKHFLNCWKPGSSLTVGPVRNPHQPDTTTVWPRSIETWYDNGNEKVLSKTWILSTNRHQQPWRFWGPFAGRDRCYPIVHLCKNFK